jgi:hypothetical protein
MPKSSAEHRVVADTAGFHNYARLTCNTCEKTLLWQPYMSSVHWTEKRAEFLRAHPCEQIEKQD